MNEEKTQSTFRFDTIQFDLIAFLRCFAMLSERRDKMNDEEFRRHVCKLKVARERDQDRDRWIVCHVTPIKIGG